VIVVEEEDPVEMVPE
jgi:hypothetical protein